MLRMVSSHRLVDRCVINVTMPNDYLIPVETIGVTVRFRCITSWAIQDTGEQV